jgi:hypothetical protein
MTHPMTPTPTPPGWRDISTAPRDGTRVLVYNVMTGPYSSEYRDGEWPLVGWHKPIPNGIWYPVPTLWQPLPPPPPEPTP